MADCDSCSFYVYDEDYEEYECQVNMDEDDYGRIMSGSYGSGQETGCPFFRDGDEYKVVRHQM